MQTLETLRDRCVAGENIVSPALAAEYKREGAVIHATANGKLLSLNGKIWAVAKNAAERAICRPMEAPILNIFFHKP